ncbi:MAG TPA: hypothetical protein VGP63_14920 [Planctomycetaceae bacterium]|jgi:hypothetical protein|nr:hypothetical protein [Planctomycetaceae bacterium]
MLDPATLPTSSDPRESKPNSAMTRVVTALLCLGVVLCGVAYAGFWAFSGFERYDDEGVVMLFVQHLLSGHAIYDRVNCLYGPFYLFLRWVVFGVLEVPLGNDALRMETLVTWLAATLLLALTAWQLVRDLSCRIGVTALVWILAVCQLFVLPRESGHPQEVVAVLVAAALLVAVSMANRRGPTFLLLGGLGAAIVLTKVNVGIVYLVSLTLSLLALTPASIFWLTLRWVATGATLALPFVLMRSRLGDGYWSFCLLIISSLLPSLLLADFKIRGTVRFGGWLWCGLGAAIVAGLSVGFAIGQGNTVGGMVNAIGLRTWRNFAGAPVGLAMTIWRPALAWVPLAAALGLAALGSKVSSSRFLWCLRLLACAPALTIATSRTLEFAFPIFFALPLMWLLLVPPKGVVPSEANWFFRSFLAFSACLQPLQIFPVTGSQKLIGTLVFPIAAVVLALDARREIQDLAQNEPSFFSSRVPSCKRLAVIATALVLMRLRGYEILGHTWWLPSATSCWALVGAASGLAVLRFESSDRKWLWPVKLIFCAGVVAAILTSAPWNMAWFRWVFPFSWLVLIEPSGSPRTLPATYTRLALVFAACLETLHLLPIFPFLTAQLHFGAFLMVAIVAFLLVDVARDLGMVGRPGSSTWRLAPGANTLLLLGALLLGGLAFVDAEEGFRKLTPLDFTGCHWVRVSERDAAYYTFLTKNIRPSSNSFIARFGLASLHFWTGVQPSSDVVPISNLWSQMDQVSDNRLVGAHESFPRMFFIDDPDPWNPVLGKLEFMDFISTNFKVAARLGGTRLLIRNERDALELYDCAFQRAATKGRAPDPVLHVRLPASQDLKGVAAIELVDLDKRPAEQFVTSTSASRAERLTLTDSASHALLPAVTAGPIEMSGKDKLLHIALPPSLDLKKLGFPALRFLDSEGRSLSTLPVVTDGFDTLVQRLPGPGGGRRFGGRR